MNELASQFDVLMLNKAVDVIVAVSIGNGLIVANHVALFFVAVFGIINGHILHT